MEPPPSGRATSSADASTSSLPSLVARRFPPMAYGFAYGSGVFEQPGLYAAGARPMLDMIFVAQDAVKWHEQNLERNRGDYSFVGRLGGAAAVDAVARRVGAGVYFNTLVPLDADDDAGGAGVTSSSRTKSSTSSTGEHTQQQLIKYGVVSLDDALDDLRRWTRLYVAGRLQKPVLPLAGAGDGGGSRGGGGGEGGEGGALLGDALRGNRLSALRTALLLSPETFTLEELLRRVVALSYTGDVRMGLAEDARKVERIVAGGGGGRLRDAYAALLKEDAASPAPQLPGVAWLDGGDGETSATSRLQQDCSVAARAAAIARLPPALLWRVAVELGSNYVGRTASTRALAGAGEAQLADLALCAARAPHCRALLVQGLHHIVRASSGRQAVAGVLSAGAAKSLRYLAAKLQKAWWAR